ncbi:uncharacterized protein LOC129728426 [Wyeomyia smithii]|uniref:uncharacterized protein LOC129728426 n=1 Tax=Wyeomyia smithii TaxID=174621 RepID=UPI002467D22F|nr:uncharacterized protein LOC129728426 [Wyeomyia smithii]
MESLLHKRNLALERLKRENASAKSLKERQAPTYEVKDRLRKLHELEEGFDRIQTEIEDLSDPAELSSVINFRIDFETLFYATKGLFTSQLVDDAIGNDASLNSRRSTNSDATYINHPNQLEEAIRALLETQQALLTRQVAASTSADELAVQLGVKNAEPVDTRLSSYTLPVFKGERKHWPSFNELFLSSVDNKNLTNALKLQLLLLHLDGEAKNLVSTYKITDVNYKEVWDTLIEYYDKPKFAVAALIQEFCDQPVIKTLNLPNVRKLVSISDEVIRQLKAMGPDLRSQWAQYIVDIDNPHFDDLLKFLKTKCDAFETCAAFSGLMNESKRDFIRDERKSTIKKEVKSMISVKEQNCPICSENRVIYKCNEFKSATVQERRELAHRAKLCFNCLRVSGISDTTTGETRGVVALDISSRFNYNLVVRTQAYILPKLARNLPEQKINLRRLKCLQSLQLADPEFDKPGKIDLILGADVFLHILEEGKLNDENGIPVAVKSTFGWIVAGQIGATVALRSYPSIINLHTQLNVDKLLRLFWEVEEVNLLRQLTQDETKAVEFFHSTHQRDAAGRFVVRLPFDESKPALGDSLISATQRLKSMERKFKVNPEFKKLYRQFMTEYLELGHMERVPPEEVNIPVEKRFYFPHHAVLKSESTTTKLRVVFDGSSKTTTGISLNDRLLVGPNINEDFFAILTRFRTYAVAFMADAEKMYRQVKVHKEDADFQRILWREETDQPIEHYRLLTVTYGTACATYLAIECLQQAARDCQTEFPMAADRIKHNFYVDDLLSGADTLEDAIKLKAEINRELKKVVVECSRIVGVSH